MNFKGQLRFLWLTLVVVIVDAITKQLAAHYLFRIIAFPVCPGFNLVLVHNTGSAFGFLSNQGGWQVWLFTLIALAVGVALVVWLSRLPKSDRWTAIAIALILGGAIGNGLDRIALGYVIDFIDLYVGQYHWPAFNVADICITTGAIMFVWKVWKKKK